MYKWTQYKPTNNHKKLGCACHVGLLKAHTNHAVLVTPAFVLKTHQKMCSWEHVTACNGFVHLPGLKLWKMRAKKCIHRCINVITIRHRKQHTPLGFTTITAQRYVCSYHGTKWGDAYLASSSELWGCLAGVLVRISNSSNIVQYNLTYNIIWTEIRNWPQTALAAVKSLLH